MVPRTRGEWIVGPCTSALETPSPCPGRVNQCTPSYSRARHQPPWPPVLLPPPTPLSTPPPTLPWPTPTLSPASTTLSPSRDSGGSLFFVLQKGELGGVGDVRLLHYVFLTEPPLTSTLPPPLDSSSLKRSFFSLLPSVLRSFSMPTTFPRFSCENESFSLLKSFFSRANRLSF